MRRGLTVLLSMVVAAAVASAVPVTAQAAPGRRGPPQLSSLVERIGEAEATVVAAERAAAKDVSPSEEELARQVVAGQLQLSERDYEGAAITFLDIVENHKGSQAEAEATYYLGVALTHLDMPRWSGELYSRLLGNSTPEARRFHQRAVAGLFDLTIPRREDGFARRPGLSATPEVRARLQSVGLDVTTQPPTGVVSEGDAERLVRWAQSFPAADREPELRYAYGRYLFLQERYAEAQGELDGLSPLDIPISRGGPNAKWRLRASYISGACSLGLKDYEDAVARFERITKTRPSDPRDRQIVELAWMAVGRIHHDVGETEDAVKAYRRIGRDSVFFPEAMYETAWTLLRAQQFDQAEQALDLLLIYDSESPIVPEIKQLRGKVKIQRRDYPAAEEEFLSLRRDFADLGRQLQRKLRGKSNANEYFAAVVGENMEHFSLAALLPVKALPVARGLPRAVQAEGMARDVGHLERELTEIRDLLARMEEAVAAREKARLFNDLGAHVAGLDNADNELVELREQLVFRLARKAKGPGVDRLEGQRRALRARLDEPGGTTGKQRRAVVANLQHLAEQAHKLDLVIGAMRAELVATERYYEETRKDQKIDHQAFLKQAAELRDSVAALEKQSTLVRDRISRGQASLRYDDPLRVAHERALEAYGKHLSVMYAALSKVAPDPDANTVWKRALALEQRSAKARSALDRSAALRLRDAQRILVEERANLDQYVEELGVTKGSTKSLVGDVLAAAYADIVGELGNLVMRSEVGLLDVAWAMKEAEAEEVQRLELERDRDLRQIDWAIEAGTQELEP